METTFFGKMNDQAFWDEIAGFINKFVLDVKESYSFYDDFPENPVYFDVIYEFYQLALDDLLENEKISAEERMDLSFLDILDLFDSEDEYDLALALSKTDFIKNFEELAVHHELENDDTLEFIKMYQ